MRSRNVQTYTATVSADGQVNLDAVDLSLCVSLVMTISLTGDATGSGTLDAYLQSRDQSGIWKDRIASVQLADTLDSGETREYVLQSAGTLADAEEASEPSGSLGASRLTAGTVKNGPFPGVYRNKTAGTTETAWRLDFDIGSTGSFPLKITILATDVG